jgi:hypothetical protein
LALVLRYELQSRLTAKGRKFEWADVIRDLAQVTELRLCNRWKIRTYVRFLAKVFTTFGPARRAAAAGSAA